MSITIFHLSDFHYKKNKDEAHGFVLNELIKDLRSQKKILSGRNVYLAFSGDIVQSGEDGDSYADLLGQLKEGFDSIGITRDRIICVPGNHDICRKTLSGDILSHEGVVGQLGNEETFNNFIGSGDHLTKKFNNFYKFSKDFAAFGVGEGLVGEGHSIGGGVAIYCLNTALCSGGGLSNVNKEPIRDKGRLAINSRALHLWVRSNKDKCKILVMHHSLDWLADWAKDEIRNLLGKEFKLLLSGHTHEQSAHQSFKSLGAHVECSAPPLYTHKGAQLGYSRVDISSSGDIEKIVYRQLSNDRVFVAGTSFSNSDNGEVDFSKLMGISSSIVADDGYSQTLRFIQEKLREALRVFSSQSAVFIDPVLKFSSEAARDKDSDSISEVCAADIVQRQKSVVIYAPAQFGLTCLSWHLVETAWRSKRRFWINLDAKHIKPNRGSIGDAVTSQLVSAKTTMDMVECIVLDSLKAGDRESAKLVRKIIEYYSGYRFIFLVTSDGHAGGPALMEGADLETETFFLWSMDRSGIRKVVSHYLDSRPIGDEDAVVSKLVSDIEAINIHRTPLNCMTLLKVSEFDFDESPVNRTEMIKRVLFLLFNVDNVPSYKTRPDVKDCEYVLGYFSEWMIRSGESVFTHEKFLSILRECSKNRMIELDVEIVFDVLYLNRIIVSIGNWFQFRFSYWVYFFAAQRMLHNKPFCDFILSDSRYTEYPEVIEFYTGSDRRREDAIIVLTKDLESCCSKFKQRLSLPVDIDIFGIAQWTPSEASLIQMQDEVNKGVQESNLPTSVKDRYADLNYDKSKPYKQDIRNIFDENSYGEMLQVMKASARALRNSDYADPELKRKILSGIFSAWEQAALVILFLIPVLAEKGNADFEGIHYHLDGDFGEELRERFTNILSEIPQNVTGYYQDDVFSQKMVPLFYDYFDSSGDVFGSHLLSLILIRKRPKGWRTIIEKYVASLPKNSFYLYDVFKTLRGQYRYSYADHVSLDDMKFLIIKAAAKHVTGSKDPGIKMINSMKGLKTADGESVIPEREVNDEL